MAVARPIPVELPVMRTVGLLSPFTTGSLLGLKRKNRLS
jgi:hypothetical protein